MTTLVDGWSRSDEASDPYQGASPGKWRSIPRAKTYELVIDQIEEQILTGQLRVGDRMPSERDLATMLGVSRSAVREAIRMLQAQGVLQSAEGRGPDSGTVVTGSSREALTRLLRLQAALTNSPVQHVVETRVMLERWSVRLAVAEATPGQLAHLSSLLDEMTKASVSRRRFNDLDTAFHVAIAEAGGNWLVADLTGAIRESLRYPLLAAFEESTEWDTLAEVLRAEHCSILERLVARDSLAAADAVEAHIRNFFGRMERLLPVRRVAD